MSAEIEIICRGCGQKALVTSYQALVKKHMCCRPCMSAEARAMRVRRAAEGNPIPSRPEYAKVYYEAHKRDPKAKARRAADQRRYVKDPVLRVRYAARWAVRRAVASGALVRNPCEVCGNPKAQGHHDDYSKPLVVRWLCASHHREHHANIGETK